MNLSDDIRRWLSNAWSEPWPRASGESALDLVRAALADGESLPMPAGFTLVDSPCISAGGPRVYDYQSVLGYHPSYGTLISGADGETILHLLRPATTVPPWPTGPRLGNSWQALFESLRAIERLRERRFGLWIRVMTGPAMAESTGRYRGLADAYSNRGQANGRAIRASLGLGRKHKLQSAPLWRNTHSTLLALGVDLLVACDRSRDVERVLRFASERQLPAQPEAWGGHQPYGQALPREAPAYQLDHGSRPVQRVEAAFREDDECWVWSHLYDNTVTRQKLVHPGRLTSVSAPSIAPASPRLIKYLYDCGWTRCHDLRDPNRLTRWLADQGLEPWSALLESIERDFGGLVHSASWGTMRPGVVGPWAMIQLQADGELSEIERVVQHHEVELFLIGWSDTRYGVAIYVDMEGTVYELDAELDAIEKRSSTFLDYLEDSPAQ